MIGAEITAAWTTIGWAVVSTTAILATVIVYTRLAGLRSFSKMSSFDFAVTIAIGSTMASVAMGGSSLLVGVAVLAAFYGLQATIALLRRQTSVADVVDNDPIVLMVGSTFVAENLDRGGEHGYADEVRMTTWSVIAADVDLGASPSRHPGGLLSGPVRTSTHHPRRP